MEHIKDLQEIQMEIKKELGGASLNHFFQYTYLLTSKKNSPIYCFSGIIKWGGPTNAIHLWWEKSSKWGKFSKWEKSSKKIFDGYFILLNNQKQALNIFAQSENFQRKLYDAIQIIKNINN